MGEPKGERGAGSGRRRGRGESVLQDFGKAGINGVAGAGDIAADEDVSALGWGEFVLQGESGGEWSGFGNGLELLFQIAMPGLFLGRQRANEFLVGDFEQFLGFLDLVELFGSALVGWCSESGTGFLGESGEFELVKIGAEGSFERGELELDMSGCVLESAIGVVEGELLGWGWDGEIVTELGWGKKGLELEIIALGERLELMIMAAGAGQGEAGEDERGRIGHVVEGIVAALDLVGGIDHIRAEKIESGCDEGVMVAGEKFVAGELFKNEEVVRFVGVEGLDDIIAITPGIGADGVVFEAVAFGESG